MRSQLLRPTRTLTPHMQQLGGTRLICAHPICPQPLLGWPTGFARLTPLSQAGAEPEQVS
eukprot:5782073-Alexandrium_andersonii.AAC.1